MISLRELLAARPGFEFPTHFALAGALGDTLVCFQNFYDQIFRDADVPVELHLLGFDQDGRQTGAVALEVGTGAAIQVPVSDVGMKAPGLIAVAALPRFDLRRLAEGKLHLKRRIGTGFYVIWRDAAGHVDTMHEWLAAAPGPLAARTFYVVFDHAGGRIARYGLVLMSPIAQHEIRASAQLELYTRDGRVLASASVSAVPAMGLRIVYLDEVFSEFSRRLEAEESLGVRVAGRNLVEPFSLEVQRSGDFHIHHIN